MQDYLRYRPGYPDALLVHFRQVCGLTSDWVVADVGSGTGLLSALLLENGNRVYGVEPNDEMRAARESYLADNRNFISVAGSAEDLRLETNTIDLITAGPAFHWFDPMLARREFLRVLKPEGWVALVWNDSPTEESPFLQEYEQLARRFALDAEVARSYGPSAEPDLAQFFGPQGFELSTFENGQMFDFEALAGRLRSSSYAPTPDHPEYPSMIQELRKIFDRHQRQGLVSFAHETRAYIGRMS